MRILLGVISNLERESAFLLVSSGYAAGNQKNHADYHGRFDIILFKNSVWVNFTINKQVRRVGGYIAPRPGEPVAFVQTKCENNTRLVSRIVVLDGNGMHRL
jgi:hypothetical protein